MEVEKKRKGERIRWKEGDRRKGGRNGSFLLERRIEGKGKGR